MTVDPLSIEKLEEHKQKDYFKLDSEWVMKMKQFNPEGYAEAVEGWKEAEAEAKMWRGTSTATDVNRKHLHGKHGWTQLPTLVVPGLLYGQMVKRFGPEWGRYNFLRYGIWLFYPTLRTADKWHGRKRGIDKQRITDKFNT